MERIQEAKAWALNGYLGLMVSLGLIALGIRTMVAGGSVWTPVLFVAGFLVLIGLFTVQPNEARALVLFGNSIGTLRQAGFWWANPFAAKKHVSLRIYNFNSERLKVNDTIRGNPEQVAEELRSQVQPRLDVAGVEVLETRLSHLAYAPEIAQVMLRRQQAEAIIAARQRIVEGAVGMVQMALKMLGEQGVVNLDEEKRAAMVSNLLTVLVAEQEAQPVINTGSLYQ